MNIEELYQEVILDHSKRPRNFGALPGATATVKGDNPSCGDEVELAVKVTPEAIEALKFTGHGCAICMASASLMTLKMRGKSHREARATIEAFRDMLTAPEPGSRRITLATCWCSARCVGFLSASSARRSLGGPSSRPFPLHPGAPSRPRSRNRSRHRLYAIFFPQGPLARLPDARSARETANNSRSSDRSHGRISRFSVRRRVLRKCRA